MLLDGTPAGGATVTIAAALFGDGSHFFNDDEGSLLSRTVVTADDGSFTMPETSRVPLVAVAERQPDGRSKSTPLPPGDSPSEIDLILQPTSSLQGTITYSGRPLSGAYVVAMTRDATRCRFATTTDDSGHYDIASLSPDEYVVTASYRNDANHFVQRSSMATIAATTPAQLDVVLPSDESDLQVDFQSSSAPLVAQVWLLTGNVQSTSAGALEADIAARGDGTVWFAQVTQQKTADLIGVTPGAYSLCATTIFADAADVSAKTVAMRQAARQPTRCLSVSVTAGASTASIAVP